MFLAFLCLNSFVACSDKDKPEKPDKKNEVAFLEYTIQGAPSEENLLNHDQILQEFGELSEQKKLLQVQMIPTDSKTIYCLTLPLSGFQETSDLLLQLSEQEQTLGVVSFPQDCDTTLNPKGF